MSVQDAALVSTSTEARGPSSSPASTLCVRMMTIDELLFVEVSKCLQANLKAINDLAPDPCEARKKLVHAKTEHIQRERACLDALIDEP